MHCNIITEINNHMTSRQTQLFHILQKLFAICNETLMILTYNENLSHILLSLENEK